MPFINCLFCKNENCDWSGIERVIPSWACQDLDYQDEEDEMDPDDDWYEIEEDEIEEWEEIEEHDPIT